MSTDQPNEPSPSPATDAPAKAPEQPQTASEKFRRDLESKQGSIEDYDPEEELWTGGYSGKAMVGTWILLGLISVGIAIISFGIAFPFLLVAIPIVWIIGGLVYAKRRLGVHYQLTSQRFIHQVGILTRKTDRIEVIDLDDVSFTQGPVERIFGVGQIVLTGSDRTHPTLSMIGIANVKEVAGLIDDVRRQERRRRSLHIEAI
ncbi:MAG: PH domain-containing protein [Planctomycetota bacterium]